MCERKDKYKVQMCAFCDVNVTQKKGFGIASCNSLHAKIAYFILVYIYCI